jgi:hypothetical protein
VDSQFGRFATCEDAETTLSIIHVARRDDTYWKAVCDESRKHGLEGGGGNGAERLPRRPPTLLTRHVREGPLDPICGRSIVKLGQTMGRVAWVIDVPSSRAWPWSG